MNRIPLRLFVLLAASLLALGPASAEQANSSREPEILGLYFHAHWCGYCKQLDPQLEQATPELAQFPFRLVSLDMSNKASQHAAAGIAESAGVSEIFKKTGVKTGFILLVDVETGRQVGRIKGSHDAQEIVRKVADAVKSRH